jgi:hypothetical protein
VSTSTRCHGAEQLILDPFLYKGVHVSLIGHDVERIKELGKEVRSVPNSPLGIVYANGAGRERIRRQDRFGRYTWLRKGDLEDLIVCIQTLYEHTIYICSS